MRDASKKGVYHINNYSNSLNPQADMLLSKTLKSQSFSGITTTIKELETSVKRRFYAYLDEKYVSIYFT